MSSMQFKLTGERQGSIETKLEIASAESYLEELLWVRNTKEWNDYQKVQWLMSHGGTEPESTPSEEINERIAFMKEHIRELKQLLVKAW